jgi:hypothetical protein
MQADPPEPIGVMMAKALSVLALGLLLVACGSSPSSPYVPGPGPLLLSPAQGDTIEGKDVQFSWDAVTGATRYYFQISSDSTMADSIELESLATTLTTQPGLSGDYWWRVRASMQDGVTEWSETWWFHLLNPCL